jgi:hypothetical protein
MDWNKFKEKAKEVSGQAFTSMAVLTNEISTAVSQADWFKGLNEYTSEISKSMDANFLKDGISKVMTPSNHRIMDGGHDFFSTINKAQELGEQNGWDSMETFQEWAQSYFTDLSSSAGMPIFGKLTDEIYTFLRAMNIDEANARDFVTVNGQEALEAIMGGAIAAVALAFAWKKEDKEAFSKAIGCIVCSGALTMNPASIIVAVIALAFGYNKLVCKETVARSAITSGVGLFVSAVIPGPILLGLIPAIIASVYVSKKMGKDFKPVEMSTNLYNLVRSEEFRKTCMELYTELRGKIITVVEKEAA